LCYLCRFFGSCEPAAAVANYFELSIFWLLLFESKILNLQQQHKKSRIFK
jgi:hypothetical protein